MKPLIIVIFLSLGITLNAQNNTSILFKKGAELEYKSYDLKTGTFSKNKYFEITRLIYTVQDVRDSNNIKYSYITKKGINPNDEKLTYEKKYVITSDGKNISIPIDFYGIDTIYFSNRYPTVTRDKGIASSNVFVGKCIYNFPTNFTKDKFDVIGTSVTLNNKIRDYETPSSGPGGIQGPIGETTTRIVEHNREMDMTIKKFDTKGVENMSTTGGTYECNTIAIVTDLGLRKGLALNTTLYYNTEVGLVKSETQVSKYMVGYTELVRVKK
jgi:hypothetical protein